MQYRMIGDKKVSLLGFGMLRLPLDENGKVDERLTQEMVDYAIENGVNYFDTSSAYIGGQSEVVTARCLKKYSRDKYYVVNKLTPYNIRTLNDAINMYQKQLKTMDVDYFDFYLFHTLNKEYWHTLLEIGAVDFIVEQHNKGFIKKLGFSFHDNYDVFKEIINYRKWDFCQIIYNYLDTDFQAGDMGYKLAQSKGIPMVIMEPNKGGTLTSLREDLIEPFKKYNSEVSLGNWNFRWVASHDNVSVILSGMSNMEQVIDNVKTANQFVPLNDEECKIIKSVKNNIIKSQPSTCNSCKACRPCPHGVDIVRNYLIWNIGSITEDHSSYRDYTHLNERAASNCVRCGYCENVCPKHLHIMDDMFKIDKEINEFLSKGE